MRVTALLSVLVGLGHLTSASPTAFTSSSYLAKEDPIALQRILDNIGPNLDANPGVVVASPSTDDPNYLYTWTRDAALTMKSLIDRVAAGTDKVQGALQHIPNLSGNFSDLSGLGEPKFNINATAFTGPWGRPQRDGEHKAVNVI
jgi:glucoamylase